MATTYIRIEYEEQSSVPCPRCDNQDEDCYLCGGSGLVSIGERDRAVEDDKADDEIRRRKETE